MIDTGTGWLFEPDSQGDGTESYWPDVSRFRRAVAFFAHKRFQCVTHATGDRGVHEALNAYRDGIAAATDKGDKQAMKEMQVFAKRLAKPVSPA